jgi:hypothetical protein
VHALHEDEPLSAADRAGVREELDDLAEWLALELDLLG